MPWSTGDVDEHKKGLSPEQKKKWVDIANGVLKSCLAKKGKNCDAMAIRVANSKVTSNLEMNTIQNNFLTQDYVPTIVERNGTQYYVVPVVMMVEGVHNGSHGPIYHSIDELGKIPESWNGIPVTIGHPFNEYGEFVSANSPDILEEWAVGTVFNTSVDGNKLRAEVWLETKRLQEVSFETLRSIQMGKMMEVSVGIFSDEDYQEGDWNGEHYISTAKNHKPDHLALLPGEVGACSVDDGCGLRVNSDGGTDVGIENAGDSLTASMQDNSTIDNNTEKGGDTMCVPCKEKVDQLITHESTLFTESDREWLEALTEDKLDKLIPKIVTVQTEVKIQPTLEEAWDMVLKDLTDFISHVPEEAKVRINAEFVEKEERRTITEKIIANSEWSKDDLDGMSLTVLKKLESTVKVDADFTVNGIRRDRKGEKGNIPVLPPTGVKFN